MANTVRPEMRRFRPYVIILVPIFFLICIAGGAGVLIYTRDVVLAAPFFLASYGPARMMRWVMVWLSTPDEQQIFARGLNYEPVLGVFRAIFGKGGHGNHG